MHIDVEDELSYLEGVRDNLNDARKLYLKAKYELEAFELKDS